MVRKTFIKIVNEYPNLSIKKKAIVNKLLFFWKNKLRSYYTIPQNKTVFTPSGINVFNDNEKKFEILKNHYIDKTVRDRINSVSGYIPYLSSQTSIYFYHFFSINYGLRKTLIGQISLVDENDKIQNVCVVKFPSRFNGIINLNEIFGDSEGCSCVLEVYHPRILNNHGGHQGHLRYWGVYGKDLSTVHSMPLFPFFIKDDNPKLAERRFYPRGKTDGELYFYNFSLKSKVLHQNKVGDFSNVLKDKVGFTIQMEKDIKSGHEDLPTSVWHHAPLRRNSFLSKDDLIKSHQLISLPDVNNIDCQLFFGEYIVNNQEIELSLFNSNHKNGLTKKIVVETSNEVQLSNIYEIEDLRGSCILIKPTINNGKNIIDNGYVNVQYISDNTRCDGVHSHGYTIENPSQGLKFMHYKVNEFYDSYVSIWGLRNSSLEFRMRVLDSKNEFEKCYNLKVEKNSHVLQLNLKEFGIKSGSGIIQIECDKFNPPATSFIHKLEKDKTFLSVCHLTGG